MDPGEIIAIVIVSIASLISGLSQYKHKSKTKKHGERTKLVLEHVRDTIEIVKQ